MKKLNQLEQTLESMETEDDPDIVDMAALKKEIRDELERLDNPSWELREGSDLANAELVILDECSMIDDRIGKDLLEVCKKILVLGDPAQLPPVKGAGYFTNRKPDHLLTNVVRHDNGILHLATKVRNGELSISFGDLSDDVSKIHKGDLTHDDYAGAEQIITGRNSARMRLNTAIRKIHGFDSPYPVTGDKVICLRNNRDNNLVNGQLEVVDSDSLKVDDSCISFSLRNFTMPEDSDSSALSVYTGHFDKYKNPDVRMMEYWQRREFDEFDFGYAITVHKAQGSQWSHPWLCDDGFFKWNKSFRQKWLYTAITRAVDKLTIVA